MRFCFLFFSFFLALISVSGQGIGLHLPRIDWRQIDTDTVRVIYPEGYEAQAQRVAALVHRLQRDHRRSVGDRYYKFDLVLQNHRMEVNGYVALAPFRSEFFTTPPQSFHLLGTNDWNDLLAVHEFRHVQQASNERRGATKILSILQGQTGWAVGAGLATPNWFSEGDAVVAETAFTNSGRGRLPHFTKGLRALELNNVRYSYAKTRNGSLRDLVPSHYPYGYLYNTYARREFGNDVWRNVLAEGAAYKTPFYSFSRALKRATGLTTKDLYDKAMEDLSAAQRAALAKRSLATTEFRSPSHSEPADYLFAHPQPDGSIIALRSTFKRTPELVKIDGSGRATVLTRPGIQREAYVDVGERMAVWMETRQNPRYQNEEFSEIMVYELNSGRLRRLTNGGKYLNPSLSQDQSKIVGVEYTPSGLTRLVILSTAAGEVEKELPNPDNLYLAWPGFSPDGKMVYALAQRRGEVGIVVQAVDGSTPPRLIAPFSAEVKDMMTIGQDGRLYFSSNLDGIDNIYSLAADGSDRRRHSSVATGAYYPGIGADGTVIFSETYARGHRLATTTEVNALSPAPEALVPHFLTTPEAWAAELPFPITSELEGDFPTKDISDNFGGFKLHSWSFNGSYVAPAVGLAFDNALSTASLSVDADYNINEARTGAGLTFRYGGFYPVLEVGARYRERAIVTQNPAFPDSLALQIAGFNQTEYSLAAEVPLQWVAGNFRTSFRPRLQYSFVDLGGQFGDDMRLANALSSVGADISFGTFHRIAPRQVQPRFGFSTRLRYNRTPEDVNLGNRFLWRNSIYLPGLALTHGFRIDLDVQNEKMVNAYQYPDLMQYVRGYSALPNDNAFRLGVNYQLPLLYPDWGIAGITYFRRVRLNAFFDTGTFRIDAFDRSFSQSSVGGELFFDNRWMNAYDISIGVQIAYVLERDYLNDSFQPLQFQILTSGSF